MLWCSQMDTILGVVVMIAVFGLLAMVSSSGGGAGAKSEGMARNRDYPFPGEQVTYAEVDGDGSVYRYTKYGFDGRRDAWDKMETCYCSSGKGCSSDADLPLFPYAVSVTHPNEKVEINDDEGGFLMGTHPKSAYYADAAFWKHFYYSIPPKNGTEQFLAA